MNKRFKHWYYDLQGFVMRCETAESELVGCQDPKIIELWLERAFLAGLNAQQRQPQILNEESLKSGSAGWTDTTEQC